MIASVYPSGDQSSLMGCPGPRLCVAVARGVGFAARSYKISRPLPSFSVATANCALLPGLHADMTLLSPSEVGVRCIWHVNAVFLDPRTVMATSFAALAVVRKSPPDRLRSPPSVVRLTSSAIGLCVLATGSGFVGSEGCAPPSADTSWASMLSRHRLCARVCVWTFAVSVGWGLDRDCTHARARPLAHTPTRAHIFDHVFWGVVTLLECELCARLRDLGRSPLKDRLRDLGFEMKSKFQSVVSFASHHTPSGPAPPPPCSLRLARSPCVPGLLVVRLRLARLRRASVTFASGCAAVIARTSYCW